MAYFGAVSIVFAVYLIWREYSSFLDGELSWCRGFLKALCDYRDKVRCYMITPSDWAADYSDERLSSCGFLGFLLEGSDFMTAYKNSDKPLCLTDATDSALTSCFSRLGEGYLDTELEALGVAVDKLIAEEKGLSESLAKRRKALGAMLGAVASGIVILVM